MISSLSLNPASKSGHYELAGELSGHRSNINAVAFSIRGVLVASCGGPEGIKLWDMLSLREVATPAQGERGEVTVLAWVDGDDGGETLCIGTNTGYLILWKQNEQVRRKPPRFSIITQRQDTFDEVYCQRLARGGEITCMSVDGTRAPTRIVIGMVDHIVVVVRLDAAAESTKAVFGVHLPLIEPAMVSFYDTAGGVLVFSKWNGMV